MPNNLFQGPIDALATLIANCAVFQSETGTVTAAAALAFIHDPSVGDIASFPRPRAIIGSAGGRRLEKESSTGWRVSGPLDFEFQRDSDPGDVGDHRAGKATFGAIVDDLLDEMKDLAGSNGYLDVRAFVEVGRPTPFGEEHADGTEYWGSWFEIHYRG